MVYLKGKFALDLIALLPFHLIVSNYIETFTYSGLVYLLKLIRAFRASHLAYPTLWYYYFYSSQQERVRASQGKYDDLEQNPKDTFSIGISLLIR